MDGIPLWGGVQGISMLLGLALGVVGSVFASFLFQRAVNRRLRELRSRARLIAAPDSTDFDARLLQDEIGALAVSLRHAGNRTENLAQMLEIEQARREAILASLTEGVLAVDAARHVVYFNLAFAHAVGAGFRAVSGMSLLELVRDPDLLEMISGVLASQRPARVRLRLAASEGRTFDVQVSPISGSGNHGVIVVLYELSEFERVERVRKDFVMNVSHELRTPLAAIQGYAETLLDGALEEPARARSFVEIISRQAERLHELTQNLMTLATLESVKPSEGPQVISVPVLIESALRSVELEAEVRGITVVRGPMEEVRILANRGYFEQALVNLLHNAIRFNHKGGEVRIQCVRENDKRIAIVIEDTGVGIPSEDLPRVFERFYRVDRARSRDNGGSGLGLAIARHAIEQMGGTITAQSQLGHGSRFSIGLEVC